MKRNMRKLNNQKGFTLIEVLIAVMILAIIVTPLLHAFVTAAKTNTKTKEILRSTTLGENIMEELKSYTVEEIARQFNCDAAAVPAKDFAEDKGLVSLSSGEKAYEVIQTATETYSVIDKEVTTVENGVSTTVNVGEFVGQSDGTYEFRMEEVSLENGNYDVSINLTRNAVNGTKNFVDIKAMNREDCGYYAQNKNLDSIAAYEFAQRNDSYKTSALGIFDTNDFLASMSRKITVTIEADASGNQSVQVGYVYTAPSGYVAPGNEEYSEYSTIFDNYANDEELEAVYIYYYPLYGTSLARKDMFEVVNLSNLDVDVYFIRMKNADYSAYNDQNYHPYVTVTETEEGLAAVSAATICTNVKSGNGTYTHNVSGVSVDKTDLGNEKAADCYYDVTITIYKHAATTFLEENKITSFTGSLLDRGSND